MAKIRTYSLSDYTLSVKVPEALRDVFISGSSDTNDASDNTITIGGNDSYTGSIQVSLATPQWRTEGDSTGSWVHSKSLDRHGTLNVAINQVADKSLLLVKLFETYYSADTTTEGLTITVQKMIGGEPKKICSCQDCYIPQMPNLQYQEQARTIEWQFTVGNITFGGEAL